MVDESHNSSGGHRMDLNLYLGLPLSPRPESSDLGSDLALSCPPLDFEPLDVLPPPPPQSEPQPPPPPPPSLQRESTTGDSQTVFPADDIRETAEDDDDDNDPRYDPTTPHYDPYDPRHDFAASFSPSQEPEEPDIPYAPSSPRSPPVIQELDEPTPGEITVPSDSWYDPVRYPSHFMPAPAIPHENAGATLGFYPSDANLIGVCSPSFRLSNLDSRFTPSGEARYRQPRQGLRSFLFRSRGRSSFVPNIEQVGRDNLNPLIPLDYDGKRKVAAENAAPAPSEEEEKDDKSGNAVHFECNICFDMAAEPVVTSCGHLFCWPCLHQWLHQYSDHKECPVCKGEVTEANITPIYGRGSTKTSANYTNGGGEESSPSIPPRPRGNRLESFRQQVQLNSRRLGERIQSWRHLLDQHMRSRRRLERHTDPEFREVIERFRRRISRLRVRRPQRDENHENGSVSREHGSSTTITQSNQNNMTFVAGDEYDHRFSLYTLNAERLAELTADLRRVIRQFSSNNLNDASTSSAHSPNPEQQMGRSHLTAVATDQASASSTMAVIQGDVPAPDAPLEPNCAESSRPDRRSERSSTSSSFDVDGVALHSCKRRRLN